MCLGRNQEEVLELHALGCRARCKFDALQLPEHERYCVPQLHTCKVNTDTGSCTSAEGVEGGLGCRREGLGWVAFFRGNPAVGVEAGMCKCGEERRTGMSINLRQGSTPDVRVAVKSVRLSVDGDPLRDVEA